MADKCRWCKGTGVIAGFAWNNYPCECRETAKREWVHERFNVITPRGVRIACETQKSEFIAWLEVHHPWILECESQTVAQCRFESLSAEQTREWHRMAYG